MSHVKRPTPFPPNLNLCVELIFLKDSKGRNITSVSLEDLRPKNKDEYLLLSSHYKSYDSRYFGLIKRNQILNIAEIKFKF